MLFTTLFTSLALPVSLVASAPNYYPPLSLDDGTKRYYVNRFCNSKQRQIEQTSWNEALQYAKALASWQPGGDYQAAMDVFMGTESGVMVSGHPSRLAEILLANIAGAVNVHNESSYPRKQRVFVSCSEPLDQRYPHHTCNSHVYAYAFNHFGIYYENHYIVFCPRYYLIASLAETLNLVDEGHLPLNETETFANTRGKIYFHESLHMRDLTTPLGHPSRWSMRFSREGNDLTKIQLVTTFEDDPHSSKVYGPRNIARFAKEHNTGAMTHIADAYACAAAAIFAQQHYNLTDPPMPDGRLPDMRPWLNINSTGMLYAYLDDYPQLPQWPNPNTPDNHVGSNDWEYTPITESQQPTLANTESSDIKSSSPYTTRTTTDAF